MPLPNELKAFMASDLLKIEVIFALPEKQEGISLTVPTGSTVEEGIRASGILEQYSQIDLACMKVGIYGKKVDLHHVLEAGDRVEIYRPVTIDPKEARRKKR